MKYKTCSLCGAKVLSYAHEDYKLCGECGIAGILNRISELKEAIRSKKPIPDGWRQHTKTRLYKTIVERVQKGEREYLDREARGLRLENRRKMFMDSFKKAGDS